jgi:hypothetical protein
MRCIDGAGQAGTLDERRWAAILCVLPHRRFSALRHASFFAAPNPVSPTRRTLVGVNLNDAKCKSMQSMPSGRSKRAPTAVVSVLVLAALLLLGLVLAYWTWTWFGPRAEPRIETAAEPIGRTVSASALFGRALDNQGAGTPTGLGIDLLGVMVATSAGPGYALVRLNTKQVLWVRAGEDIAPGIRLDEVFPDHVTLQRNGTRETLALPEQGKSVLPLASVPGK